VLLAGDLLLIYYMHIYCLRQDQLWGSMPLGQPAMQKGTSLFCLVCSRRSAQALRSPCEGIIAGAAQQVPQQLHPASCELLLLSRAPLPVAQAAQQCQTEQRTACRPLAGIAAQQDCMTRVQPIACKTAASTIQPYCRRCCSSVIGQQG